MESTLLLLATSAAAYRAPTGSIRMTVTPTAATTSSVTEAPPLRPPFYREDMLDQAAKAVSRACEDGINRPILRLFLPRGDEGNLFPPDESWQGGIMQLYKACSPLCRD